MERSQRPLLIKKRSFQLFVVVCAYMVSQRSPFISRPCGEPEDQEGLSLRLFRLRQGIHNEFKPEGAHDDPHGGEAVQVPMDRMQTEVYPVGLPD